MLGIDKPTDGTIRIDGLSPHDDFMAMRGKLAVVFQTDRLLPWRTVIDNAAIALEVAGVDKEERYAAASSWLTKVGLGGWEEAPRTTRKWAFAIYLEIRSMAVANLSNGTLGTTVKILWHTLMTLFRPRPARSRLQ